MDLLDLWREMASDPTRSPEERAMIEGVVRDVARDALVESVRRRAAGPLRFVSVAS